MVHARLEAVRQHVRGLAAADTAEQSDGALLRAFVAGNDQAAFAALVRRRGPLVLAVCRRVLQQTQDAEDSFQATFLLLAQNAAALCRQESLAGWLHGVAWRMAHNARRVALRRRRHERRARAMATTNPEWDAMWREVQAVLDEEVGRLPAHYRDAFILCCLENQSGAEAARQLGVKEGTVKSRLCQARRRLQQALARRGMSLSAVLAASALTDRAARAAVSGRLATCTANAVAVLAAGKPVPAGAVSASVLALLKGAKTTMLVTKLKTVTVLLLALAFAGIGLGLGLSKPAWGQDPDRPAPDRAGALAARDERTPSARPAPEKGPEVTVAGRVLDPAGKPVAGARLYLGSPTPKGFSVHERGTTDADGRFRVGLPGAELARSAAAPLWQRSLLMAMAPDHGPDWVSLDRAVLTAEVSLRLVPDDAPIRGRILDGDGRPVGGAQLRVVGIAAFAPGGLDRALEYVRRGGYNASSEKNWPAPLPGRPEVLTTDRDGRFTLKSVGRERVVRFHLAAPAIQHWYFEAMTRNAEPVRGPDLRYGARRVIVYGAQFDHVAAPSRPVRGTVRDKATGKPVAGVRVSGDASFGGSTTDTALTDRDGHYELLGYPQADRYRLLAQPAEGQPYFGTRVDRASPPGLDAVPLDIDLVSGIPVSGHVRDAATNQPVSGARVEYHPLYPNPFVRRISSYDRFAGASSATTRADGSYRLVVLPGPGVLALRCPPGKPSMAALVTPDELAEVLKDGKGKNGFRGDEDHLITAIGENEAGGIVQTNYQALALIKPDEQAEALTRDLAVHPGRTLKGTVLGPDGRPLAGATLNGAPLTTASFTLEHVNPRRTQRLEFDHKEKRLGLYRVVRGDESQPLRVQLQPYGSVVGRIAGSDGKPVRDLPLRIYDSVGETDIRARTDAEGRFRVDGLMAGHTYNLLSPVGLPLLFPQNRDLRFPPFTIEPGKVKDLGDATGR